MNRFMFGPKGPVELFACLAVVVTMVAGANTSDAESPVLIAFKSDHCGHCVAMAPVIENLALQGTPVRTVNVDQEPDFARRHGVRQVPTFVVWSAGKEVTRLVGAQSAASIRNAMALGASGPLIATDTSFNAPAAPETRLAPIAAAGVTAQRNLPSIRSTGEPLPSEAVGHAIERARAATVRLRVHDGNGFGVGTGTIIDRHGEESLVLTCGHLFRETKRQARIEVDLFYGGEIRTVPGQVIDYDADERDIALVVIRPQVDIGPVKVLPSGQRPTSGQSVFSFGCDHGDDPSRRDTRLTGINKYNQHVGASNLEIAGAPVDGRSGGGLFDNLGRLIGVCNAADYKGDVGIYTGPGSVYWQLDRVKLAHLYQSTDSVNEPASQIAAAPQEQKVTVIVQDLAAPGKQRVMELHQPSPELMQMIERQSTINRF
ncbi:MAG: trypsin-like peptidase domain-containing protein [Planctomycetota bacterium]